MGETLHKRGEREKALECYEQSLNIRRKVGDLKGEGETLNNIAAIYRAQGNPVTALKYFEQALAIRRDIGDKSGEVVTCWNIGLDYEDLGDFAQAEACMSQVVQIAETIDHPSVEKYRKGLERVWEKQHGIQHKQGTCTNV